jgi:hypothetical protein
VLIVKPAVLSGACVSLTYKGLGRLQRRVSIQEQ